MTFDDTDSEELDEFAKRMNLRFSRKTLNSTKSRIRNALSRESQASKRRNAEMAHYLLNQLENEKATKETPYAQRAREQHAVVVGVSRLTSSVLHSIDVNAPIVVEKAQQAAIASAKTDFDKIIINVKAGIYNENDRDAIASLIHLTKGLVYHEGGHIKFTTPFNSLLEMSGLDLPPHSRFDIVKAWNILEDQRMETAMCSLSPVLAKYFTSIVINVVVDRHAVQNNWPWLVGRTYLPSSIRKMFREAAMLHHQSHLIPDITECVMQYRKSTDAAEMVRCVVRFAGLLSQWGVGGRNADEHNNFAFHDKESVPKPENIPQDAQEETEQLEHTGEELISKGGDESDEKEEGNVQGVSPEESEHCGAPGEKSETPEDINEVRKREQELERLKRETGDLLKDELANSKTPNDQEIDDFIASVNEIKNTLVMPDRTISPMSDEEIKMSLEVSSSMLSVLESLFVQVEPTWALYQEDGILDPTAYLTREPGDVNFWSGLDGSGNSGHDISVSVLLDSSGSMSNSMDKVSVSAMGIRHACDQLGIPCTITTFNDDVHMVAPANDDVGFVRVSAEGGTSVFNAMMAIDDQKHGRTYHLVIILTDGEWFDVTDLRLWSQPQRHIVVAGFGYGLERYVSDKYADSWVVLTNPLELPKLVTDSLVKQFV